MKDVIRVDDKDNNFKDGGIGLRKDNGRNFMCTTNDFIFNKEKIHENASFCIYNKDYFYVKGSQLFYNRGLSIVFHKEDGIICSSYYAFYVVSNNLESGH